MNRARLLVSVAMMIRKRMKALGMRKTELAAHLGVSKKRVTKILNGEKDFTLGTLAEIDTVLGMLELQFQANVESQLRLRIEFSE